MGFESSCIATEVIAVTTCTLLKAFMPIGGRTQLALTSTNVLAIWASMPVEFKQDVHHTVQVSQKHIITFCTFPSFLRIWATSVRRTIPEKKPTKGGLDKQMTSCFTPAPLSRELALSAIFFGVQKHTFNALFSLFV